MPDALSRVLATLAAAAEVARDDDGGKMPDAPPQLAEADPDRLAVAVCTADGRTCGTGPFEDAFTIQSISKPLVYAMALQERGVEAVLQKVDVEPSGESFDTLSVEPDTGRPDNPMINAGAITVHTLVGADKAGVDERSERILEVFSALAGRRLEIDHDVASAEFEEAHRNLAIAHLLRSFHVLPDEPADAVLGYVRQCAVVVTCEDLAVIGATLAAGGRQPRTGERIFEPDVVKQTLSVMLTCGMYDATGDWVSNVGIPAKSGVGGGILGAVPGRGGLATFSPPLDEHGNSVRGVRVFEQLSSRLGLHFIDALHEEDHRWEQAVETEFG